MRKAFSCEEANVEEQIVIQLRYNMFRIVAEGV
jgi:hypothetical protein